MVLELKLRKVGRSLGVILPDEILSHLKVGKGDSVYLTRTADGSLRLSGPDDELKRQMDVAEDISRRYRNALRDLAK